MIETEKHKKTEEKLTIKNRTSERAEDVKRDCSVCFGYLGTKSEGIHIQLALDHSHDKQYFTAHIMYTASIDYFDAGSAEGGASSGTGGSASTKCFLSSPSTTM